MDLSTFGFAWSAKSRSMLLTAIVLAGSLAVGASSNGRPVSAQDHGLGPLPFTVTFGAIARDGAAPTMQDAFVLDVVVTEGGGAVTFVISVTSEATMTALIDLEVYAPGDDGRVLQQPFFEQKLQAGVTKKITHVWTPEPGQPVTEYVAKVGIFSAGWEVLFHWSDSAAVFSYP
jgi:hypothetical protein